jgi:hypothetical protein
MTLEKKAWVTWFAIALLLPVLAIAQQQAGVVKVNIGDIRADIAKKINVDVSQVPARVQVPVDVAAKVCDVAATQLASQAQAGIAGCTAKSASSALNDIVQQQVKEQQGSQQPQSPPKPDDK